MERHIAKEERKKSSKHYVKGPKKRTSEDDDHFQVSLIKLIETVRITN
jgi:uncharacterized protein YaiI (UPF0178 family)